jgi:membrane protease YdiL (CAAX protease family)
VEPTLFDHLFAAGFVLGLPAYAALVRAPRLRRAHAEGRAGFRVRAYLGVVVTQWALVAAALLHWLHQGRTLDALGLSLASGTGAWVVAALAAVLLVLLAVQGRLVVADREARGHVRAATEHMRYLLPATQREVRWFGAVSVTAGCCEELLFRGLLLAYLTALVGAPAAWVLVTLAFGLGHAYQGLKGILQTGALGAVVLAFTVGSGSLLAAVLLHVGVDLHSGCLVGAASAADGPPEGHRRIYRPYVRYAGLALALLALERIVALAAS